MSRASPAAPALGMPHRVTRERQGLRRAASEPDRQPADRPDARAARVRDGGPDMAPKPPNVRSAPAEPWRFSGMGDVVRGPEMAPKPPNVRRAPWRFSR